MTTKNEAQIYSTEGKAQGTIALPAPLFDVAWNADLVHQVITSMRANEARDISQTKDRSEVRGGGKKPWRQKGTGNARHGSRRSPLWAHGGVTFGPGNDHGSTKKINKKVRRKALFTTLSQKLRDNQMMFAERLGLDEISTKSAHAIIKGLASVDGFATLATPNPVNVLVITPMRDEVVEKSFRNLPYCHVEDIHNINAKHILQYRYVIVTSPEDCIAVLESKLANVKA